MRKSKSSFRPGRRHRVLLMLFAMLPAILATTGIAPTPAAADHLDGELVLTTDTGGADDWTNPNRNDLNLLGFADDGSGVVQVAWSLDDTSVSGGEESQGCALYDTDGDGNVNYSLCVSLVNVDGTPTLTAPILYNCTDQKDDTCSNGGGDQTAGQVTYTGTCELGTIADPFAGNAAHQAAGGQVAPDPDFDSFVSCDTPLADLTEGDSFSFLNVCTYPSEAARQL